jgi:hypothetical protein
MAGVNRGLERGTRTSQVPVPRQRLRKLPGAFCGDVQVTGPGRAPQALDGGVSIPAEPVQQDRQIEQGPVIASAGSSLETGPGPIEITLPLQQGAQGRHRIGVSRPGPAPPRVRHQPGYAASSSGCPARTPST